MTKIIDLEQKRLEKETERLVEDSRQLIQITYEEMLDTIEESCMTWLYQQASQSKDSWMALQPQILEEYEAYYESSTTQD